MLEAEAFQLLVRFERKRQNKKWLNQEKQRAVSLEKWVVILAEEMGEFSKEVNDHDNFKAIVELAETAAVCQRIYEVYLSQDIEAAKKAFTYMKERADNQKPAE